MTTTQTYASGSNRLLTSPRGSYSYRADGSPTSDGRWKFDYDAFGRLSSASLGSTLMYLRQHDGLGMRVRLLAQEYNDNDSYRSADGAADPQAATTGTPERSVRTRAATTSRPLSRTTWSALPQGLGAGSVKPNAKASAGGSAQLLPGGGGSGWVVTDNIHYLYTDSGRLIGEYNFSTGYSQETIWLAGLPVGTMINGVLYTVRADHLGTPRSIARASDNLEVWRWDGEPFGDSLPTHPAPAQSIDYNLRFAGQLYEPYTGYFQNWHRDYDPYTGRYLQADPIGLGGGWNRYTYVEGNPLVRTDQTGLFKMYGNWGGAGWSGGEAGSSIPANGRPPVDALDGCYKEHDYCYAKEKSSCQIQPTNCDVQLAHCLARTPRGTGGIWGSAFGPASLVWAIFKGALDPN